jgi:hypothetical protein
MFYLKQIESNMNTEALNKLINVIENVQGDHNPKKQNQVNKRRWKLFLQHHWKPLSKFPDADTYVYRITVSKCSFDYFMWIITTCDTLRSHGLQIDIWPSDPGEIISSYLGHNPSWKKCIEILRWSKRYMYQALEKVLDHCLYTSRDHVFIDSLSDIIETIRGCKISELQFKQLRGRLDAHKDTIESGFYKLLDSDLSECSY